MWIWWISYWVMRKGFWIQLNGIPLSAYDSLFHNQMHLKVLWQINPLSPRISSLRSPRMWEEFICSSDGQWIAPRYLYAESHPRITQRMNYSFRHGVIMTQLLCGIFQDNSLAEYLRDSPSRAIIALEDVDSVFTQRESSGLIVTVTLFVVNYVVPLGNGREKKAGVSFSGLLNAIGMCCSACYETDTTCCHLCVIRRT
jgi:hypothetical protein